MMDLLPEHILKTSYRHKHDLEYISSMDHIKMFKQHYDDIPRYIEQVYGDRFQQIELNIPIKEM